MATGTAGSVARHYQANLVHYLRLPITFADAAVVKTVGVIPAGSIIIDAGIVVSTLFNAAGNDLLDIGTSGDPDGLATDLTLAAVGLIPWDESATSNDLYAATDTTIVAEYTYTSTAPTTGAGVVFVAYLPNNG